MVVEAALANPSSSTFYIFHDDFQAVLPFRSSYPIQEPMLDLSRNCRNAGRIFELMCHLRRHLASNFGSSSYHRSQAAFDHNGWFIRVDILNPVGVDAWVVAIELKSGTTVKDVNLLDIAFQKHVCDGAGLRINQCYVMHVNPGYVRSGDIVAAELLHQGDVAEEIEPLLAEVPVKLEQLKEVAAGEQCPAVAIGRHCNSPYECPLRYRCWDFLPEYPITDLYRDVKKLRWNFLASGITGLADIPADVGLNEKHEIQRRTAASCEPHVALEDIGRFLGEWNGL